MLFHGLVYFSIKVGEREEGSKGAKEQRGKGAERRKGRRAEGRKAERRSSNVAKPLGGRRKGGSIGQRGIACVVSAPFRFASIPKVRYYNKINL